MNKLPLAKRAQILGMMVEGMSIRSIVRMIGASKNTIAKLIVDAGTAFAEYQDQAMRDLPCKRVQVDEIWSFVGAKEKNASPAQKAKGFGDIWTWTAICADTKLIPSFYVGERDGEAAMHFIDDLSRRMAHRIQLSSDGHKAYLDAVEGAFGGDIDYAMIVKMYGTAPESAKGRYSPAECTGIRKTKVTGNPDPKHVSTSYAERANLSIRMGNRRFTRLTNAFSKKAENHAHAMAIYLMHYNFCRIHQTLRCTPAMAAGVTERLWSLEDMAALIETPRGEQIREVRGVFDRFREGVTPTALRRAVEQQVGGQRGDGLIFAVLRFMHRDEAEFRDGLWFPEKNWARLPE